MSNYPTKIDTDADIPRIGDNITEIGSETINELRTAVFAIQSVLGINPQGTTLDVVTRLDAIQNSDGTFKASALVAAGLIALPITNSMIGASAAIEESKLDLDVATQILQDQITSNDIDILALQNSIDEILTRLAAHIAGTGYRHTTAHIDIASPLTGITATDLQDALEQINDRHIVHAAPTTVGAHTSGNITVVDNFTTFDATNAQEAFEELDKLRARQLITHRDEMHSNGFSNWSNIIDGYNINGQLLPLELGLQVNALVPSSTLRNILEFDGYNLVGFGVSQGDVVVVTSPATVAGQYIIDDVGPRNVIGSKPLLELDQLEITGSFAVEGPLSATIYAQSSINTFQGNSAPTIHQSGTIVDSMQCSRPNAARIHTLGLEPRFITSAHSFNLDVGMGSGIVRSIAVDNLNQDRNGALLTHVTPTTIVERLNSIFQNASDGYAIPVAAYRVDDEIVLAHNWQDNINYTLEVQTGTGNFVLGLDGYGANVVETIIRPTQSTYFYVNGYRYTDYAQIASGTGSVAVTSQTVVISGFNPLTIGVRVGHLVHITGHSTVADNGTYLIVGITSTTIDIHRTAGITSGSFSVEILHDAIPLNQFRNSAKSQVISMFYDQYARASHNNRLDYTGSIANLDIIDISDGFLPGNYTITSVVNPTSDYVTLQMGADAEAKILPRDFYGQVQIYDPSNVETVTLSIVNPIGAGAVNLVVSPHVYEEEVLEVGNVFMDGIETLSDITDKRLFGSTGLDEVRDDYTLSKIEIPQDELRANGIIRGFNILDANYTDASFVGLEGILIQGGTAFSGGVRCDILTSPVMFPNTAGTFIVGLNEKGSYEIYEDGIQFTLGELIDGYGGNISPIVRIVHDGANVTNAEDLRFFINELDNKIDLILDTTNRMIGTFATVDAALAYINNYPQDEKFKLKIVSTILDDITIANVNRDLTLVLDGTLNNLTLDSPCRVISESVNNRTQAHIDGYLTITTNCTHLEMENIRIHDTALTSAVDGQYLFKNCLLDGDATANFNVIGTNAFKEIAFRECTIGPTYDSIVFALLNTDGIIIIDNCYLDGGPSGSGLGKILKLGSEFSEISNSIFENYGIYQSLGTQLKVTDCTFKNMVTGLRNLFSLDITTAINSLATNLIVSDCTFYNITTDGFDIIQTPNGTGSIIGNCLFDTIVLSLTFNLINRCDSINGCLFRNITYGNTDYALGTNNFSNNISELATSGEAVIRASVFTNNNGFHTVQASISTGEMSIISDNIFATATSPNIDFEATARTRLIISNNKLNVAASVASINMSAGSGLLKISGNYFRGADATSTGIALNNAGTKIVISDNIFDTITAISTTAAISDLIVSSNHMEDFAVTMEIGTDFIFANNIASSLILSPGTPSRVMIEDNVFADTSLTFSVPISDFIINGNIGKLNFTSTLADGIITSNVGPIEFTAAADATNVLLSENRFDSYTNAINTWTNSIISNNSFVGAGDTSFDLVTNSIIKDNIFDGNVDLSGTLTSVAFIGNQSTSANNLTINNSISQSLISGNNQFAILATAGAPSTVITNNYLSTQNIDIDANAVSCTISANFCNNLIINADSTSGLNILGNTVFAQIEFSGVQSSLSIIGARIANNTVSAGMIIGHQAGTTVTITQEFSNCIVTNNTFGGDVDFFRIASLNATYLFSDNTISGNVGAAAITMFRIASGASYGTATANNNIILNNRLAGQILIREVTYSILIIQSNFINSGAILPITIDGTYDDLAIIGNFINTSAAFAMDISADNGSSYQRINISNNTINNSTSGAHAIFFESQSDTLTRIRELTISNNIFDDQVITINSSGSLTNFNITNFSLSGNIFGKFIFGAATDGRIDFENTIIENNIISADNLTAIINPGIRYFLGVSASLASLFNRVIISNNIGNVSGAFIELSTAITSVGVINLNKLSIRGNVGLDIITTDLGNSDFSADDLDISSNRCDNITLSGFVSLNTIRRAIISNNSVSDGSTTGLLTLPTIGTFDNVANQSKITNNYADIWSSAAAFSTAGNTEVFVWGNTQGAASTNVTFGGTTATNTATANDVTTAAPTGISA